MAIALGSNLGDRAANLHAAVGAVRRRGVEVARCSGVWETAPVPADQPAFLNAVVWGATPLAPGELLDVLQDIEWALGRRPSRRWGPRPIDLDILFYGAERIDTERLTIPHPRIAERSFVLAPLSEVHRGELPVLGETALVLLDRAGGGGLRRVGRLFCEEA